MNFKHKLKRLFKHVIGDFSGVQWRDIDHRKVYLTIAALIAVIVLIIVLIVGALKKDGDDTQPSQTPEQENVTIELDEENQPADEVSATEEEVVEEDSLEVNVNDAINELINKYFTGLSSGNLELVASAVDVLSDEEKLTIERKKDYIEAYNNITCYTKNGLEEGSYVVFTSYDMKIYNIETAAPGIMALYVCTADDGSMYIFNGEASEELTNYVLQLASEEDVAAVITDVDTRYQQLVAQDEDLGKFAETMLQSQQEDTAETEPEAPAEGDAKELETPVETTVNDGIKMREGRSTESAVLGTLATGTTVKVYASYEDGWSKIEFDGMTGYCKTEFLTSTEGVPTLSVESETTEEGTAEETTQTEETTEEATVEPTEEAIEEATATEVNKTMQIKEAIRIRADRSAESERLANAYTNEFVTVIENYSDGWSKVDYNGTVGYCKTEFLKEPE
ncbi:MAG: SH3 domain-containing protein [Lachnospiraceae bacterium]|nr:SH3 domain-containing protein [Lachnospiraceae bacterium]